MSELYERNGRQELPTIKLLEEPFHTVDRGAVLKVIAITPGPSPEEDIAMGYVSTKSGRATMLGEFSGETTGEYAPCNAVKGWVGDGTVYEKTVTTDTPLSGFRTAIAQRRAERTVRKRLSS